MSRLRLASRHGSRTIYTRLAATLLLAAVSYPALNFAAPALRLAPSVAPHSAGYVYAPIALPGSLAGFDLSCRAGETCGETLGNGDGVYYSYGYNRQSNPYGARALTVLTDPEERVLAVLRTQYRDDGKAVRQTMSAADGTETETDDVYDGSGRLIRCVRTDRADGGRSSTVSFAYDANGNILREYGAGHGAKDTRYAYNGFDQRVEVNGERQPGRYTVRGAETYDEDGNAYVQNDAEQTLRVRNYNKTHGKTPFYGYLGVLDTLKSSGAEPTVIKRDDEEHALMHGGSTENEPFPNSRNSIHYHMKFKQRSENVLTPNVQKALAALK